MIENYKPLEGNYICTKELDTKEKFDFAADKMGREKGSEWGQWANKEKYLLIASDGDVVNVRTDVLTCTGIRCITLKDLGWVNKEKSEYKRNHDWNKFKQVSLGKYLRVEKLALAEGLPVRDTEFMYNGFLYKKHYPCERSDSSVCMRIRDDHHGDFKKSFNSRLNMDMVMKTGIHNSLVDIEKGDVSDLDTFIEEELTDKPTKVKSDGGKSSYYNINTPKWFVDKVVSGELMLEDVAEVVFDNDFNYTNVLKAMKRVHEAEKGCGKEGNDIKYDITKMHYYTDKIEEKSNREV